MEVCKAGRQQKEPGIQNGHTGRHPCGSAYGSAMKSNAGNRAQAAGDNRPKRTALRTTCPDNLSKQSAQTTYPNDRTQPGKRTYTDDRTRVVNRTIADRQNDRTETGTGGRRQPARLNAPPAATPRPTRHCRAGAAAKSGRARNPKPGSSRRRRTAGDCVRQAGTRCFVPAP